ncbi:MAG: LysM peptidoglycan-binding domain-containing protein [Bacteroidales bacterium]|nr:LysM peptidoglycan-binding domain-containing protein [Bacteroidales bacterium]
MKRIFFITILSFVSIVLSAQTKSTIVETTNSGKFYIHTVQAKETFYGLSKVYGVSIEDIKNNNDNIQSLSIGQKLRIPVLESVENSQYSDGEIIVKNGESFIVHNVQQGETIYALARKYDVSAGQILSSNPSINNGAISVGQQLFIPFSNTKTANPQNTASQQTPTTAPAEQENTLPQKEFNTIQYTVTESTLEAVSEKTHVPVEVIKSYNPDIQENITNGQTITIPTNAIYFPKSFIFCSSERTTLSDMAEKYHVALKDILHHNSYGVAHFNEGVFIQIPINAENIDFAKQQIAEQKYMYHTVQQGETQYSISHLYHVKESLLVANNINFDMLNLAPGMILKIPYQANFYEYIPTLQEEIISFNGLEIKKNNIHIALLLPFFLDKNKQQNDDGIINKPKEIYEHTYQFLEYYEGALMALDSLKSFNLNITLDVIESNNDSATTNINKIKTNTDLIIGPVFPKTFPAAAAFAKRHAIPIISPLSTEETNSLNPFVVQVNTPQKYRFKAMVEYILENNTNTHVCIIYNSENLEKKSVTQCKAAFNEKKGFLEKKNISFEEMYYPTAGAAGIDRAMNKKEKTILIILSKQQAFANNIVTKLYQASKSHQIELWGLPQWEFYENLELDFLYDLNFKLVTSGEIDYSSPRVNQFITEYREKYNTEPSKFSFQGFDQMLFFVKHYATSSDFIAELQTTENGSGLYDNFNFVKKDGSSVNTTSFIIEYDKKSFSRKATLYVPNK